MDLPISPPILPMLAKRVSELPKGELWIYEPKWDGFRALVFRDGTDLLIQSRDKKPLNRYFPELIEPLLAQLPYRCVLDGEIVIASHGALDFDALQLRIHPAASRVKFLSQRTPASIVFFDLLSKDNGDLREEPFSERRRKLEQVFSSAVPPVRITQQPMILIWLAIGFAVSRVPDSMASWRRRRTAPMSRIRERCSRLSMSATVTAWLRFSLVSQRRSSRDRLVITWPLRRLRRIAARSSVRQLYAEKES